MALQSTIEAAISEATETPFGPTRQGKLGGGCINDAFTLSDGSRHFFVKINDAARAAMFEAEAEALRELAAAEALRVPRPIVHGEHDGYAYLVLEQMDLSGRGHDRAYRKLGEGIAALHAVTAPSYGWHRDNFIGATPQPNRWHDGWVAFFRDYRLRPQLRLASERGAGKRLIDAGERLAEGLESLFLGYTPPPSLLHGDLWGGNAGFSSDGAPVLYDPATYYGDRETDLAMTELFGGFPAAFYEAYDATWPRDPGYATRRDLYQLYHMLNHFNLFGGMYLHQSQRLTERLLAAIGR
ncbi:MAG: fructosamine kinase family protein [Halorhodospira sp.]